VLAKSQGKITGRGGICMHCGIDMDRHTRTGTKVTKTYYFAWWDICRRCKRIQHYDAAKIYPGGKVTRPPLPVAMR
jgi:hypothetical protein